MGQQAGFRFLNQKDGQEGLSATTSTELRIVSEMTRTGHAWATIHGRNPELASYVEKRFASHEHHVLATVRSDGSPRVSGTNVMFTHGILWIGMMPTALRAIDLRSQPYCALHSAPLNEKLPRGEGDVRLNAIARELTNDEVAKLFHAHFPDADDVMPGTFFELLTTDFSIIEVDNDEIVLTRWSPTTDVVVTRHHS